ncbi:hypothetical protein Athai_61090 [Actinocatenispora thailandica]|uniref:histidine kinase n=1 Tax=Actinocatenispora thailandica TaxID=227318 RepID=A0A7R7DVS9_9ACTN|nr:CHASE3 domain-containing protein [Actinocatenispora thailandica]BCJ38606.1 hypothetical protein Athai_61090 [Actinocatenispora thailandica]
MRRGLTRRIASASTMLAAIIGGLFAVLVFAIADDRETARLALRTQQTLANANQLERLLVDIETGERGYLLTGEQRFLVPWTAARRQVPAVGRDLVQSTAVPEQRQRARSLVEGVEAYIADYSVPLVQAVRAGEPMARSADGLDERRQQIDSIREQFTQFDTSERQLAAERDADARRTVLWALGGAVAGTIVSVVLIAVFAVYVVRYLIRPVRHAARISATLAGGDLAVRMPETGPGEVGELERAFNTMGRSLERGRDRLSRFGAEQAALRRVATLVARGVAQQDLFTAVTAEVGSLLKVDGTRLQQYRADGSVVTLAVWAAADAAPMLIGDDASAGTAEFRSSVSVPITVEGRLWGQMTALSTKDEDMAARVESHFADFTDLVAIAIANGQARAELLASRARVVAATDQARHQIERDLHDGVQQQLVSLALDLRVAEADVPPEAESLRNDLQEIADGLGRVLVDLRELSRGIHPAILSEAGLPAALRALARRSRLPVELDIGIESRLPQQVEVTAYFVAAEALANAAKYAQARTIWIRAAIREGQLVLTIGDDGVGGADPARGSGLIGLADRVAASAGTVSVRSPRDGGTEITATLPVPLQ